MIDDMPDGSCNGRDRSGTLAPDGDEARTYCLNEAMFREGDERMNAWPESREADPAEELLFLCECADPDCRRHVSLTTQEYEAVRANTMHFLIVSGHERPNAERVIRESDRYAVIEKNDDVRAIVERTDPRTS